MSISIYLISFTLYAMEFGSERFTAFTQGASDYPILVGMGQNPNISSNRHFTDQGYVSAIASYPFPEGAGQKYYVANMMNFQANYVMAGAKADPRNPGFLMNSLDRLKDDPEAELELENGITESKMAASQAGENSKRYIAAEIISPNVGYYQSADNQQSFESAYDNILLGEAEEALYKGDENQAKSFFNNKAQAYNEGNEKQFSAGSYQKDALMRSKKTAETFRDFFEMKAGVSQENLNLMPTTSSLVNNCQKNTPRNEDLMNVYNSSLPSEEVSFYNFQKPQYDFDFCEVYVDKEESYLIQNTPVHGQLGTLVEDSTEMAQGLNDIVNDLSDKSLTAAQISGILSKNSAWNTLSKRAQAYEECKKVECLKSAKAVLKKIVDYPGSKNHQSPERQKLRATLDSIIQSKSLSGNISEYSNTLNLSNSSKKQLNQKLNLQKSIKTKSSTNSIASKLKYKGQKPPSRDVAALSNSKTMQYTGKRYPRSGGYFRGEDGVLRNPRGFPVTEFLSPADHNIFDVISKRYQLKFSELAN